MLKGLWNFFSGARERPQVSDDGYLYLFLHVAKAAGSTVNSHIQQIGHQAVPIWEKHKNKAEILQTLQAKLKNNGGVAPSDVRMIYGHRVFRGIGDALGRDSRFGFFLRDPVELIVSLYNHYATGATDPENPYYERNRAFMFESDGKMVSFRNWLREANSSNVLMNFLYHSVEGDLVPGNPTISFTIEHLEVCKKLIDDAYFVGFLKTFDRDAAHWLSHVGVDYNPEEIKNVSKKFFRIEDDPDCRELILERDKLDCELYQYALEKRSHDIIKQETS